MSEHNKVQETQTGISRRQLLGLGLAGIGAAAMPGLPLWAATRPERKIGLQLYTLRDLMAESVPKTLKRVATIGYKELEFAGYFGHKPKALREILDGEGLTAPAAHVMLDELQKDFERSLETAQILGHHYIVVPYLDEDQRGTDIDTYKRLADSFNRFGERCKKAGLKFAYHNHEFEFETRDGQVPYNVLLGETDPELVYMELDLYWTVKAGLDPLDYFRKHPGRFTLWHIKDMDKNGDFADLGEGVLDFQRFFAAADVAGLEHSFVERDHTDDPMRTVSRGYEEMVLIYGAGK